MDSERGERGPRGAGMGKAALPAKVLSTFWPQQASRQVQGQAARWPQLLPEGFPVPGFMGPDQLPPGLISWAASWGPGVSVPTRSRGKGLPQHLGPARGGAVLCPLLCPAPLPATEGRGGGWACEGPREGRHGTKAGSGNFHPRVWASMNPSPLCSASLVAGAWPRRHTDPVLSWPCHLQAGSP